MLQYVAIICFAVGMGGMLEKLGVLENILEMIVSHIRSDGTLILATLLVGYVVSLISCSQPMAHVLTGRLMAPLFRERKIAPEILSRCLEDAGTLAGPMIPWHGYCVYMSGTLGVAWAASRGAQPAARPILWFACAFSNAGYMGFPLIRALFGEEGVLYASAFLTMFNILVWTLGVAVLSGKAEPRQVLRSVVTCPCIRR